MNLEIPEFVTHYYRRDKSPFLNLSDLNDVQLDVVIAELGADAANGESKRIFGRRYMELRRMTESKMRSLFEDIGGRPQRQSPHYFVLGESQWFRALHPTTESVTVPLTAFPSDVTSFTYPDSFAAMRLGHLFGLPQESRPYHERVFRLEALEAVVEEHGLPTDEVDADYEGYQHREFEKYIEVQLWSDEPIREHLLR